MRQTRLPYCVILLIIILTSCNNNKTKCEYVKEWTINKYRIVESQCPDLVLAHFYEYSIYVDNKKVGHATAYNNDSCVFTWQADNENYLTFNVCDNTIQNVKPNKIALDEKTIDSVTIFSNELKVTQLFTQAQIKAFAKDWNNSKTRGYSNEPFDSAFFIFPAYQYKLTVFSQGVERPFYGFNYIILDSSNWKYEMSKTGDIKYIHKYWKK